MIVLRWFGVALAGLLAFAAVMVGWALYAWRDIPVAELEAKYGGPGLRVATVDGVPFRYRLEGAGAGRPVIVLIHSHFLDMGMWDPWMPVLLPRFAVLRYDLPAHGLTGPDPSGVYNLAREAALLDGLLQQAGVTGEVSLAGSSIGGSIAYTFAADHPRRTRALVINHSGGLKRRHRGDPRYIPSWGGWLLRLVPPSALHKFLYWMAADKTVVDDALKARFVDLWRREGNRDGENARLRQFEPADAAAVLARVRAPTLVLWGEANPQLPVEMAQQFREKLSGAASVTVRTWPGVGHLLPVERPRESAEAVRDFVLATPAGAP